MDKIAEARKRNDAIIKKLCGGMEKAMKLTDKVLDLRPTGPTKGDIFCPVCQELLGKLKQYTPQGATVLDLFNNIESGYITRITSVHTCPVCGVTKSGLVLRAALKANWAMINEAE